MADNQIRRSTLNETPVPGAQASDPLAELARLIGQTDPFGEFGRDKQAPAAALPAASPPPPVAPRLTPQYPRTATVAPPPAPAAPTNVVPVAPRQSYAGASYASNKPYGPHTSYGAGAEVYQTQHEASEYSEAETAEYEDHGDAQQPLLPPVAGQHDIYDDAPRPRRRMGIMALAAVFALAVIGTAGAFGYRTLFGSSGSSGPPPVIKADTTPSKIVPASAAKTSNKLIYDRVADRGDEKLVPREEQPVDVKAQTPAAALARPAASSVDNTAQASAAPTAALGSSVIATEPKKIRTIAIHPDQMGGSPPASAEAAATPAAAPPAAPAAPLQAAPPAPPARQAAPAVPPPQRLASNPSAGDEAQTSMRSVETRPPAVPAQRPARPRNAPLSLSPDADNAQAAAPAAPARALVRTASVHPAAAPAQPAGATAGHGAYVQLSSQRSEAEAQAAFRGLQAKFPNQLGNRELQVRKVELGQKGTFYRAMVGPFANASEAVELCTGLKAAGGQCLIQRN